MSDVINDVPRELLELLTDAAEHGTGINTPELMQARALLTAQPQASAAQVNELTEALGRADALLQKHEQRCLPDVRVVQASTAHQQQGVKP